MKARTLVAFFCRFLLYMLVPSAIVRPCILADETLSKA